MTPYKQIVQIAGEAAAAYTPPKFFRVMTRHRDALNSLTDAEAGEAFKALLSLAATGGYFEPQSERARLAVDFIRPDIVADMERARRVSAARRAAVNTRWEKRK